MAAKSLQAAAASNRTAIRLLIALVGVVTFLYAVLVAGTVLLWLVFALLAGGLYLLVRIFWAIERMAASLERIEAELEPDSGAGGLESSPAED